MPGQRSNVIPAFFNLQQKKLQLIVVLQLKTQGIGFKVLVVNSACTVAGD
jgi:hypothetical protein